MLMIVLFAFRRANEARIPACGQYGPNHGVIVTSLSRSYLRCRRADIGTIHARADTLPHVHRLRRACIGARRAKKRAIHHVLCREGHGFVGVAGCAWMKRGHLADGHIKPLLDYDRFNRSRLPAFPPRQHKGTEKLAAAYNSWHSEGRGKAGKLLSRAKRRIVGRTLLVRPLQQGLTAQGDWGMTSPPPLLPRRARPTIR
jgi:hypothetical protein